MLAHMPPGLRRARAGLCVGAVWVAAWACLGGLHASPTAAPEQAVTILDAKGSFFRWTCLSRPAVMVAEPGSAERTTLAGRKIEAGQAETLSGEMPPKWRAPEFDDSAWPRTTVGRLAYVAFQGDPHCRSNGETFWNAGVLCLRGKFRVSAPADVEQLRLSVKYRGGVVVYLNGQEVARGGVPTGELAPAAPGLPYPPEAYLDAAGKLLPDPNRVKKTEKGLLDRIGARDRVLGPVALPTEALRRGLNVLAVEIHRSDYLSEAAKFLDRKSQAGWLPCELVDLRLAAVGSGAAPNCARPAGVQVWNQDRNDRSSVWDYGDPNEKLQPIVLTGARNGVFSGRVVVSSDKALGAVKAEAGELSRVGGKGTIPASALQVQYAEPTGRFYWGTKWVEPMSPIAPKKVDLPKSRTPGAGAMVEVWLSVQVPRDAAPGEYAGTLAVSVDGAKAADVPVRLHVACWTLPDPKDFRTFVGIYQSPTAVSLTYNVPVWSKRHWELMERSMDLLGQLGNQMVQIPVVDRTRLGNDDGMLTWIRKSDGSFDHDYSVVERYLKLVRKYMGAPKFVVLHVYHAGGWIPAGPKQKNVVTVLDAKTGDREHLQVPEFGTEAGEKFWRPVLLGLKERLAKEGMQDSLVLGSLTEGNPKPEELKMFSDILGSDVRWLRISHRQQGSLERPAPLLRGGGRATPHIFTYLPRLPSPNGPAVFVHKGLWPRVAYFRRAQGVRLSLIGHRELAMHALFLRLPGLSHMCLDFWPVKQGRRDRGGLLWGRWPHAHGYPGDPEPAYLTWPGPDGAEPMTAYEALREGLQEAEALITVSKALDEDEAKLGPELAERCRQALRDELAFCVNRTPFKYQYVHLDMNHHGWRELSQRVFTLAGEVATKTAE